MVLDLRCWDHMVINSVFCVSPLLYDIVQYTWDCAVSLLVGIFSTFAYEYPLQLFWLFFPISKNGLIIRRIIRMSFIGLRLIFVLWVMGCIVNQITYIVLIQRCGHLVVLLWVCVYSCTIVPNWKLGIVNMLAVILNFTPIFYLLDSLLFMTSIFDTTWSILLF